MYTPHLKKYPQLTTNTISLHIRRGDYLINSGNHHNLSLKYYEEALKYFPDRQVVIFSDDTGTIFYTSERGRIIWKQNIYKKAYKKINKNIFFSIYKNIIYVVDNIGFVYSIDSKDGKILWIRNYEVPIKSSIKVFGNKIFLINQDNKIFSLDVANGNKIWDSAIQGGRQEWGWGVVETFFRKIVVVGSTQSFGSGLYDIILSEIVEPN